MTTEERTVEMTAKAEHPREPIQHGPRIPILPTSVLGRWAVGLAGLLLPLVIALAFVLVQVIAR